MFVNGYTIGPGAYLQGAYLQYADLQYAYLQYAYLRGAYLQGANLRGANLQGANLAGTCLSGYPGCTPAALEYLGWEVSDGWVYGVRTSQSQHVGSNEYTPGSVHEAPYLSVDHNTDCHPGIYMCRDAEQMASLNYDPSDAIRVRARCTDVVTCRKGLRVKRLEVLG